MENEQKQKKEFKKKDWIILTIGIILSLLCIIAALGQTIIGSFLAYCFAFVFGFFYPFALALLFALGLKLIFTRKGIIFTNHGFEVTSVILILVAVLGIGALAVYSENPVSVVDMNAVYYDRVLSFASHPFVIDDFSAFGALGGGYLGFVLNCLLGFLWGTVGNAVFFSLLLAIALFFLLFKPAKYIVDAIRHSIPNRNKGVSREVEPSYAYRQRKTTMVIAPAVKEDEEDSSEEEEEENETPAEPEKKTYPVFKTTGNGFSRTGEYPSRKTQTIETSAPKNTSTITPNKEETPAAEEEDNAFDRFTKKGTYVNPLLAPSKRVQSTEPKKTQEHTVENAAPSPEPVKPAPANKTPVVKPVVEEEPEEEEPKVKPAPKEEPEEEEEVTTPVRSKTVEVKPEIGEESDEEREDRIAREYFVAKQNKAAEEIMRKEKEKEAHKKELMKFVSKGDEDYHYDLPTDDMLDEHDDSAKMETNTQAADEKAKIMNGVFAEFDLRASVTSYTIGASVTRFNVETEHGEKADKLNSLTSELQRALNGDMSVRVETVVEGKSTAGIEVGNKAPMAVAFKSMFEEIEKNTTDNLLLPIGMSITGEAITYPLNKMPHLLVAGTTGSGKSVLIHSMIVTLMMRNYPSQLKLMLIDPKQVEFVRYQQCSHLFCPVISKPESAVLALKKLCVEMDRRFELLSKSRCSNYEGYSAYCDKNPTAERIPNIVCVIDEFADLMQTAGAEVSRCVQRIAQKARAAGIYLVIATQRPSKDNFPMIIKANVPCRIGLSCSSYVDSRVILDENGAETLLGRGDLFFKCPGKKSMIRAQSPFLSDSEIDRVLSYVKSKAGNPCYDPEFIELDEEVEDDAPIGDNRTNPDGLYLDIKEFVIATGIASKSALMHNFSLTSAKADQILQRLLGERIVALGYDGRYSLGAKGLQEKAKLDQD